jgi:GntR family transcriptional regulator
MKTTNEVVAELTTRCQTLRMAGRHRLPAQRELADELNTSRSTVRRALKILAANGMVNIARGRNGGAYLVDAEHERVPLIIDGRCVNRRLLQIASFTQMLLEQGFEVGTRVLALELEAAEAHIASQLDISPSDPVVSLLRVRFADGAPLSLEHMYLSFERFPRLVDEGLGGSASVYTVLRQRYGVSIEEAEEALEITPASVEAAHLLAIEPGEALLAIRRLARDGEGRPVECSFDLFRGDRARKTVIALDQTRQLMTEAWPTAGENTTEGPPVASEPAAAAS